MSLEKFRHTEFDSVIAGIRKLFPTIGTPQKDGKDPELKRSLDDAIKNMLNVLDSMLCIVRYNNPSNSGLPTHLQQIFLTCDKTKKFVERLEKQNQKEIFTIVILGLEKAG